MRTPRGAPGFHGTRAVLMTAADPQVESLLGRIEGLIRARDKHLALESLRALVHRGPDPGSQWQRVAALARSLGDEELALDALDRVIADSPNDPRPRTERIELLEGIGQTERALEESAALRTLPGAEPVSLYHQGICLARQGRSDESLAALREALRLDPDLTQCWDYIAAQKRFSAGEDDLARLRQSHTRLKSGDPNRLAPVLHALGRAHDDMGHTDRAFEKFTETGRLMRRYSPYDVSAVVKYCERLARTYSAEFFERTRVAGNENATPIFIVGPPRSGTTLLEQMLATHPDLHAGGEHSLLRIATYPLGNFEAYELRDAFARNREIFAECGRHYWRRVRDRFGEHARIVDKTPVNHFFVGVIHLMLPNARLIWMRRDLRDTAWSCFRTRIQGNRWTETIEDTVAYLKAYENLMHHWKDAMGDRLHVVHYEQLVEGPRAVMSDAFEFLGVEYDEGWLDFQSAPNAVSTASLGQVREPLSAKSIGSWKRYAKYLGKPFRGFDQ